MRDLWFGLFHSERFEGSLQKSARDTGIKKSD